MALCLVIPALLLSCLPPCLPPTWHLLASLSLCPASQPQTGLAQHLACALLVPVLVAGVQALLLAMGWQHQLLLLSPHAPRPLYLFCPEHHPGRLLPLPPAPHRQGYFLRLHSCCLCPADLSCWLWPHPVLQQQPRHPHLHLLHSAHSVRVCQPSMVAAGRSIGRASASTSRQETQSTSSAQRMWHHRGWLARSSCCVLGASSWCRRQHFPAQQRLWLHMCKNPQHQCTRACISLHSCFTSLFASQQFQTPPTRTLRG